MTRCFRRRCFIVGAQLLVWVAVLACTRTARAGDPYLRWYTIETEGFRIHFHSGLEPVAQRVAALAEFARERLIPRLGWAPPDKTEVVLTDNTDSANGSATATPYNTIRLFAAAPDDMSVLDDHDDWLLTLIAHEDAHVVHTDNVTGVPAIINSILGKTYTPNQSQPRWVLEGLAVAMESRLTSGGRLRASQFDMYLRADVLEGNLAPLDEISHSPGPRRWPGATLWYLYGSRFVDWILTTYGEDTYAAVAHDYGRQAIGFGINRSIRRATGSTYVQLYDAWHRHLKRHYQAQASKISARGLRQGTRLTHQGTIASYPRFAPTCWKGPAQPVVLYYRDNGHDPGGIYELGLNAAGTVATGDARLVARSTHGSFAVDGSCGLVFANAAPSRRRHFLFDLFRQPPRTSSPGGLSRNRQRITTGARARSPDVSPDGRWIAYVTQRSGTSTLRLARLGSGFELSAARSLVPSGRFEQAFTPRFSPDGRQIAYGVWTRGGYRDLRVVDVATGRFTNITHDRAIERQPVWSPDGSTLYFVSDRTGVSNVFALETATNKLWQVTNVINGAFMPAISPDGKLLLYVGYTAAGFDLFSMPIERSQWLEAPAYQPDRPPPQALAKEAQLPVKPYTPLPTLRPRSLELQYGQSTFGNALTISALGTDAARQHSVALQLIAHTSEAPLQGSASYGYHRLPFDYRLSLFHSAQPRREFRINDEWLQLTEHINGVTSGISLGLPGEFDSEQAALSYSVMRFNQDLPIDSSLSPDALVTIEPHRGYLGVARVGYAYSSVQGSAYGISAERGLQVSVALDYAGLETASDFTLYAVSGSATGYLLAPWADHHVFALAASAGTAAGTYPRRGLFFTGGYAQTSPIDLISNVVQQSAFVLRGYEPNQFGGNNFNLVNTEYRFPIAYVDRGISTLPVFFRTLSGTLFADYGGAYDELDLDDVWEQMHLGVGAELWLTMTFSYFATTNLRLGMARGLDSEASGLKTYSVLAAGF